jgi:hypothetical protein
MVVIILSLKDIDSLFNVVLLKSIGSLQAL